MEINNMMDRISDLPDEILHRIMSFCETAARTRVLSKRWNYICNSSPIFDFYWDRHRGPEHRDKFRNFIKSVDSSLKKYFTDPLKIRIERFCIKVKHYSCVDNDDYTSLALVVNQWIELAMENGLREIKLEFDGLGSNSYVLPETTFVMSPKSIEYYAKYCSRFYSLEKLILRQVHISEKIICDITRNCPQLNYLSLRDCWGLKNLKISKLDKLDFVEVLMASELILELKRVDIDAPNLRYFSSSCNRLKSIKIFAPRLSSFLLFGCENIKRIEIDAPILSSFQLYVYELPVDLLANNVPCLLDIHYMSERASHTSWFLKLREFVGRLTPRKFLKLDLFMKEVSFHLQELEEVAIPPPLEVEHLILNIGIEPLSLDQLATLIDGLLWSCHPKIIFVDCQYPKFLSLKMEKITEILIEKLFLNKLENPKCCNAFHIKCWRHDLKGAKIVFSTEGSRREELLDPEYLLATLSTYNSYWYHKKMCFKLEWD